MLRASIPTKLSLARWAELMGLHPLHFAGVNIDDGLNRVTCGSPWRQYAWQEADRSSREDVAAAIAEAEAQLEQQLGFRLLPSWELDEWTNSRRPADPTMIGFPGGDLRGGFGFARRAKWGLWIAPGIRGTSLIEAAALIVWSDEDEDGYAETGTVTVATGTDACEIQAFYPGKGAERPWQIRPAEVAIVGGDAVITFRRELVALEAFNSPVLPPDPPWADGLDDDDFLAAVDVYRVYNDPRTQGSLLWEPAGDCGCSTDGCPNCAYATQDACFIARNTRLSLVVGTPAAWSEADNAFAFASAWALPRTPDIVRLNYLSGAMDTGLSCPRTRMPAVWEMVVAAFAASKLGRPPCECAKGRWDDYAADLAFSAGTDESGSYQLGQADLSNPFGTRRAAVAAWKWVQNMDLRIGKAGVQV